MRNIRTESIRCMGRGTGTSATCLPASAGDSGLRNCWLGPASGRNGDESAARVRVSKDSMGLLERAKRQGGRYLNPVPTVLGGFGLVFKVLPLYLKNKAEREPKLPLGPFRTDVRVYRQPPASFGLRVTLVPGTRGCCWRSTACASWWTRFGRSGRVRRSGSDRSGFMRPRCRWSRCRRSTQC